MLLDQPSIGIRQQFLCILKQGRIRQINGKVFAFCISLYRSSNIGRAILLNGVYLPAVMEVLRNLVRMR